MKHKNKYAREVKESYLLKIEDNENERSAFFPVNTLMNKNLKYFSLDEILNSDKKTGDLIIEYIDVYVFNLEKNVGKTFWMREEMNKKTRKAITQFNNGDYLDDKIMYMFRSEINCNSRKGEIKHDDDYQFYIAGTTIKSKGTDTGELDKKGKPIYINRDIIIGRALLFNTMGNESSSQYAGYNDLYWDEYRSKELLSPKQRSMEFTKWLVLVNNFQRKKERVRFFLFGNNEPGEDCIVEGYHIDKATNYLIDLPNGIFYFNLPKSFEGLDKNKSISSKHAFFKPEVLEFFESNISIESKKGIGKMDAYMNCTLWGYLILKSKIFEITIKLNKNKTKQWVIRTISEREWRDNTNIMTLAILTEDVVFDPRVIQCSKEFIKNLAIMYKYNTLIFCGYGNKTNFEIIWKEILPKFDFIDFE